MVAGRLRRTLASLVAAALSLGAATPDPVATQWKYHVQVLASDAFEGRLPGSPGEAKTLAYLTQQFARIGLRPSGETVNGRRTWFQSVPVVETPPAVVKHLSIDGPGSPGAVGREDGLIVYGTQASGAQVDFTAAPLVFVGYGIEAPDYGWDDYKGVDLTGKVAVVLFGDPVAADGARRFPGNTMSRYGAPRPKVRAAVRHGAAAVLIVHEPRVLGYSWATTANALGQVGQALPAPAPRETSPQAQGWVREDLATRLMMLAGGLPALKTRAGERDFRPVRLGSTMTLSMQVTRRQLVSKTVIGLLPGRTHPDETLIVGAHWDHQGTAPPDARGDRVYNGAIDNASGVATVLEVARAAAARGRPERSIAFVAWTLEEPGILGSEYYVAHPIFPLETTVAVVNFDTMLPLGRARDFSENADPASDLTDLWRAAGARQGRTLTLEPHVALFVRQRSDQGPFMRAGVPSSFYMAGEDLIDGGRTRAQAWFADYFAHKYHQRGDEYDPSWNADGVAQDVALITDMVTRLANSRQWPEWKPGAEFKAVRDRSAGSRR